jgi:signal peptide peptidase SppA
MNVEDTLWAGTEASYTAYLDAVERGNALEASSSPNPKGEEEENSLLEVKSGVGVISIKGPLTNQDSWINALIGITSYNDIRRALIDAAAHPEVKTILLDVDSGGGAVNGVMDLASLIRLVNDRIKPVVSITGGAMMSAAYWLGMSAGRVLAGKTATVGSIGVIATHKEVSEAMKKDGIHVTVLRAGKYKALANPYEPLSKEAQAQIQKVLDAVYGAFVGEVAAMRGKPVEWVDEHMAQGREFIGEEAVAAGLVDGVSSYDTLFAELSKEVLDKSEKSKQNPYQSKKNPTFKGSDMKKVLSQLELATLSALAEIGEAGEIQALAGEAVPPVAPAAADAQAPAAADAQAPAAATAPAADAQAPAAATAPAAETAPAQAPAQATATTDSAVVTLLREQLVEAQASLVTARVELEQLKKEHTLAGSEASALIGIVAKSVSTMSVALGGSPIDGTAMKPADLLAEHQRLATAFQEKFKAGGVAAVDAAADAKNIAPFDPLYRAKLAAVRAKVPSPVK